MNHHWETVPDERYLDAMDAAHLADCSARSLIESIKRGDVPGKQGSTGTWLIRAGDARTFKMRRERKVETVQTEPKTEPATKKQSLDDVVRAAQQELAVVTSQLEVLEVRRQELTEVVAAIARVQRFLRQDA